MERVVATLHPNNTFEKVVFDPWQQTSYDVNDTVTFDPKTDPDVGEFFSRLPDGEYLPTWYTQRQSGSLGADEQDAAAKAANHANTPAVAHFDTLGRIFLSVADNGKDQNGNDQEYTTCTALDIEGNQRAVIDALGRTVMRYDYDMLGTPIHQASMEAGERWMLGDVAGKPILGWNSRKYAFRTAYDALRRPVQSCVQGGDPSEPNAKVFPQSIVYERTIYGDSVDTGLTDALRQQANLRTKVFKHFDGAGIVTTDLYDFKGNSLHGVRQFASDYKNVPDWSQTPALDSETFTGTTAYDALNRAIAVTTPDNSVYRPTFNEANLLKKVDVNLHGVSASTAFVTKIDYNAKGQRTHIDYGNGTSTSFTYDEQTFRLTKLLTQRNVAAFPGDCPSPPATGWPGCRVQNLSYTYDPAGNITHIQDDAQQTIYFNNKRVEPSAEYTYDPIYRLIKATGREHLGQNNAPAPQSYNDAPRVGIDWSANDGNAMALYAERYFYDPVGNFQQIVHTRSDASSPGWTRSYAYNKPSLIEPGKFSNCLSSTTVGNGTPVTETYTYDARGNMLQLPQLQVLQWNFCDQLQMSQRQAVNADDAEGLQHQGERTYYVYDAAGLRVRKVTDRQASMGQTPTRMKECIYLSGYEIYRDYESDGTTVALERDTLHVRDDQSRVALVETRTKGSDSGPAQLIRYQLSNHLGSASLELDGEAKIISYEEYFAYGSTSYQAVRSQTETPKRYRYSGMERDEQTGFIYQGARYYMPWLARWINADPLGLAGGANLYAFVSARPITKVDPSGTDDQEAIAIASQLQDVGRTADFTKLPGENAQQYGTRMHDVFQQMTHSLGPFGPEGRVITEVVVNGKGRIVNFGGGPTDATNYANATGDKNVFTADIVILKKGVTAKQRLIDQKLSEVSLTGVDFKTGDKGLSVRQKAGFAREGVPIAKLTKSGDLVDHVADLVARGTGTKTSGGGPAKGSITTDELPVPTPGVTAVQGIMIANTIWNLANARSPREFVDRAASTATDVMASQVGEALGWYLGPIGAAAGAAVGPVVVDAAKDPVGTVHATVDCLFGGNCPGLPSEKEVESVGRKVRNATEDTVDYVMGAHWLDWLDNL